jgi:hypothetical protein
MRGGIGLLIVLLAAGAGCFGDDDDKGPAEPEVSDYTGSFLVADTLDYNTCMVTAPLGAVVNVVVAGDAISFAGIPESWDEQTLRGLGATAPTTVPINIQENCYGTYVASFDIRFSDPDSFVGTYAVTYTYTAGCQAPDCEYGYRIGGRRP